jgi:hypothetical protein
MTTPSSRPAPNIGDSKPEIVMTLAAEQTLKARRIRKTDVLEALSSGSYRVDSKSGHEVFRSGDLRVVVKREANRMTVLTAARTGDFAEHAG